MRKVGLMVVTASIAFGGTIETASQDGANAVYVGLSRTASAGITEKFVEWWKGGVNYLKQNAREIWEGVKSFDCGRVVDAVSRFDPMMIVFEKVAKPAATCVSEFRKGFICDIPDSIKDLYDLARGTLAAAWNNKWKCGAAAVISGPLAPAAVAVCGFYYFAEPKVKKMAACMKQLYKKQKFFSMLWAELGKLACNIAGQVTLDVVLELLSGGTGTGAVVAKWIKRIGDLLSPATQLKIASEVGKTALDGVIDYSVNVMKNLNDCK